MLMMEAVGLVDKDEMRYSEAADKVGETAIRKMIIVEILCLFLFLI